MAQQPIHTAQAPQGELGPLYRDPLDDGAADPVIIWNPLESAWWMVYTNRRTTATEVGVAWVHGTELGVASSTDDGHTWTYRHTIAGLETEPGRNTFWAPEIVEVDGTFHMFVSYITGIPTVWAGHDRTIRHYTSSDLVDWTFQSELALSSRLVIDACVFALPSGGYRLWYKDEGHGSNTWAADSDDLYQWRVVGEVITTPMQHEGSNVFEFADSYWMIVDSKCQIVYRSNDLESWTKDGVILDAASGLASDRIDDLGPGLHADVVVNNGRAWAFYFTHSDRHDPAVANPDSRRSSVQVAERN
jgi:beta-xylosidase